jgi:hypothetical protein
MRDALDKIPDAVLKSAPSEARVSPLATLFLMTPSTIEGFGAIVV